MLEENLVTKNHLVGPDLKRRKAWIIWFRAQTIKVPYNTEAEIVFKSKKDFDQGLPLTHFQKGSLKLMFH